jgi:hypothetical protein
MSRHNGISIDHIELHTEGPQAGWYSIVTDEGIIALFGTDTLPLPFGPRASVETIRAAYPGVPIIL